MCVSKIKQAAKDAVKFIFDKTELDYQIAGKCVLYGCKLFDKMDMLEKSKFIKYMKEMTNACEEYYNELCKGGQHE